MSYSIIGLGNPGEKYEGTRHNAGRIILEYIKDKHNLDEWRKDGKLGALVSEGVIAGQEVTLLMPETFMNNSGVSVKRLATDREMTLKVIVIHDDLDLPRGTFKISFNRGAAGQRGVESIIRELGTKAFTRFRIGISPMTLFGKLKKPRGEHAVNAFVMKKMGSLEQKKIREVAERVEKALVIVMKDGHEAAMNEFNV